MLLIFIYLILSMILLIWAAERFVSGAATIAHHYGLSTLLIGLTIVALGTSAPEIFVAITASFKGNPDLSIGSALGSNIANVGLVLALTAVCFPLKIHASFLRKEYLSLLAATIIASLLLLDNHLTRLDGGLLLLALFILLLITIRYAKQQQKLQKQANTENEDHRYQDISLAKAYFYFLLGVVLLPLGANFVVDNATKLALLLGIPNSVIGLTVISIGTSLPELAASIVGAYKGLPELAIGNVVGSNVFNLLAVLPFPGLIDPGPLAAHTLMRDVGSMIVSTVLVFIVAFSASRQHKITRFEGLFLFILYIAYLGWVYRSM